MPRLAILEGYSRGGSRRRRRRKSSLGYNAGGGAGRRGKRASKKQVRARKRFKMCARRCHGKKVCLRKCLRVKRRR